MNSIRESRVKVGVVALASLGSALLSLADAEEPTFAGDPSLRTLGGITLWEPFEPVRIRLGRPVEIIEDDGAAFGTQYVYEGLTLWAGYDKARKITVQQIEATSPKYCTNSGVCPGTPLADARRKLGKPDYYGTMQEGKNEYGIALEGCWLEVVASNIAVKSMAVRCQP